MTRDEMRQKWLDALRSGEYKQSISQLHSEDGFCCLGVACVVLKDELGLKVETSYENDFSYDGARVTAPDKLVDALGLYSEFGDLPDKTGSLASLNDGEVYTFEQIADEIETGNYWRD